MTPAARLSAAIEVLADVLQRHRPSTQALKDWGRAHRFAGSGDRAIIGNLVFDVMRRKDSLAWLMNDDSPRALVLALYTKFWLTQLSPQESVEHVSALCTGAQHAPESLSEVERTALQRDFADASPHVLGFFPAWLQPQLEALYGGDMVQHMAALAQRAPVDLRVNTLKATRDKVAAQLHHLRAAPCLYAPHGLRIVAGEGEARSPHVESEGAYQRGAVELQDEASQLMSLLSGACAGEKVLDVCAGAGGKSLALAALMQNKGQIFAADKDKHRLAPIYERIKRAGAHNIQVVAQERLSELHGQCDRVLLDVPCTGTGAWRRKPDGKWKLKPEAIAARTRDQDLLLQHAVRFLRPKGDIVYITCSILREENEDRVAAFLKSEAGQGFAPVNMTQVWTSLLPAPLPPQPAGTLSYGLRLSPYSSGTDGFFIARLARI